MAWALHRGLGAFRIQMAFLLRLLAEAAGLVVGRLAVDSGLGLCTRPSLRFDAAWSLRESSIFLRVARALSAMTCLHVNGGLYISSYYPGAILLLDASL